MRSGSIKVIKFARGFVRSTPCSSYNRLSRPFHSLARVNCTHRSNSTAIRVVKFSSLSMLGVSKMLLENNQNCTCAYSVVLLEDEESSEKPRDKLNQMVVNVKPRIEELKTLFNSIFDRLYSFIKYFYTCIQVSTRGLEISFRCSPLFLLVPAGYLERFLMIKIMNKPYDSSGLIEEIGWNYFLNMLQSLGPAFIKLGQWAATRRDLFDAYFCDRLSILHSQANVHPWKYTEKALHEAFGENYGERLRISRNDVIGSGCAAQVYKASLDGQDVAVKVIHPHLRSAVTRDLLLMERVAYLIDSLPSDLIKCLALPRAVKNFESILQRQIDLRIESNNLLQFLKNFSNRGVKESGIHVTFPVPVEGFISRDVMVEEYIDGVPISAYVNDSSEAGIIARRQLAAPLLNAFLKMVFIDNFVHCDLHLGNVLVSDKSRNSELKIVFLDAGLTESLTAQDTRNLRDLFTAVVLNNGKIAGRLMVERAKYERCSAVEGGIEAFSEGIDNIVQEFHDNRSKGLTLGAVRIGSLLKDVLDLCRVHGVEIDPSMASIVISTFVLEGLGRSLNPNLNLFDFVLPLLVENGQSHEYGA